MPRSGLLVVALLLLFSLVSSARREPGYAANLAQQEVEVESEILDGDGLDTNEGCEGDDKEECLMRRTLVAQTDYIYTNSTKT